MKSPKLPPDWSSWDELLQYEAGQDYLVASPRALDVAGSPTEPVKTLPLVRPDEIPAQPLDSYGLPEITGNGSIDPRYLYMADIYRDGSAWITFLETELVVRDWAGWCRSEGRDPERPWRGLEG